VVTVKHEDIKKTAEQYRSINGNSDITNKEMLIYLMHRVDSVDEKLSCQIKSCDNKYAYKSFVNWVIGIGGSVIAFMFAILLKSLNII